MGGQYGVKETCDVLEFGAKVLEAIKKSKEDGFSWMDSPNFVPALIALIPAIDKINMCPKELAEMDNEDQVIVRTKVLELIPEAGDGWAVFAQKAIATAFAIYELVMAYLDMKKAPKPTA